MGKKIALYVGLAIFIGSVALAYVAFKSREKDKNANVFAMVPANATFLLSVNKPGCLSQALAWLNDPTCTIVAGLLEEGGFTDSLEEGVWKRRNRLIASTHLAEKEQAVLYLAEFASADMAADFFVGLHRIEGVTNPSNHAIELIATSGTRLYVERLSKVVAISVSKELVAQAAKQQNSTTHTVDGLANATAMINRNADLNLLVHNKELFSMSAAIFPSVAGGVFDVSVFAKPDGWLCLDADIREEACHVVGFWDVDAERMSKSPLVVKKEATGEVELLNSMPSNAGFVFIAKTPNLDDILSTYELSLDKSGEFDLYKRQLDSLSDKVNVDVKSLFLSFAVQEVGIAAISAGNKISWITMLNVASGSTAKAKLDALRTREGNPIKGIVGSLLGGVFAENTEEYYAVFNDLLLLSNSKQLIDNVVSGNSSFTQSAKGRQLLPFMAKNSSFTAYFNPSYFSADAGRLVLLPDFFTVELDRVGTKAYCNIAASLHKPIRLEKQVKRPVEEKVEVASNPEQANVEVAPLERPKEETDGRVLFNQKVSGKQHVLSQGKKGSVQLVVGAKQEWVYDVDGKVEGVALLFPFKKGEHCFIMNTRSHIYMLDAKGNNVKGFPLKLASPATNSIAVFDYNNTRDYRIFVACEDKKIRLFDKQGKSVEGWSQFATKSNVTSPIQFFRVGGKDYLVAADENELYILDRKGAVRVTPSEKVALASGGVLAAHADPARLTGTDAKGKKVTITLSDGKVVRK